MPTNVCYKFCGNYWHNPNKCCVVCGTKRNINIHHVIPLCYLKYLRRYFELINADFHDCVLICVTCHKRCEGKSKKRYNTIADQFGIPLDGGTIAGCLNSIAFLKARSWNCLLESKGERVAKIPVTRKKQMQDFIQDFLRQSGLSKTSLSRSKLSRSKLRYRTHGDLVVDQLVQNDDPLRFVVGWRRYFLQIMKPKFLPKSGRYGWDVERPLFRSPSEFNAYRKRQVGKIFSIWI